jgi:hypothetical protein
MLVVVEVLVMSLQVQVLVVLVEQVVEEMVHLLITQQE